MDRQVQKFIAVVALVGAIMLAIYHFVSGNPISDYWLAGVLLVLAIVVWLWSSSEDASALFDIDPALRGGDPTHAQEAYPLNLLEEAPQVLGDVPDVAPSELDSAAVKIVQDSAVEERLTEIVTADDDIQPEPVTDTQDIEETLTDQTAEEAPAETVVEEAPIEPIEVVTTDAVSRDTITTENAVQVDAVTPDVAKRSDTYDDVKLTEPIADTTPLPDYASVHIASDEEVETETATEVEQENSPTDAPEPYSVAPDSDVDTEAPISDENLSTQTEAVNVASDDVITGETVEAQTTPTSQESPETYDLTKIEGIGVKYQEALYSAGITTFEQLAELSVEQLAEIAQAAGMRRAGSMETWAEQARLAAAGEWDALQKLQDELIGGRRES